MRCRYLSLGVASKARKGLGLAFCWNVQYSSNLVQINMPAFHIMSYILYRVWIARPPSGVGAGLLWSYSAGPAGGVPSLDSEMRALRRAVIAMRD